MRNYYFSKINGVGRDYNIKVNDIVRSRQKRSSYATGIRERWKCWRFAKWNEQKKALWIPCSSTHTIWLLVTSLLFSTPNQIFGSACVGACMEQFHICRDRLTVWPFIPVRPTEQLQNYKLKEKPVHSSKSQLNLLFQIRKFVKFVIQSEFVFYRSEFFFWILIPHTFNLASSI